MKNNTPVFVLAGAIVAAALIVGGALVYSGRAGVELEQGAASAERAGEPERASFEITEQDHVRGNPDAPVTIVEFSDLECPFCRRFHGPLKQALNEFDGQVRWVYKHFPLERIHPQAMPAALASECVAEQAGDGGFWEFADRMFKNQHRLGSAYYEEVARDLGVDMERFNTCLEQEKYADKIASHRRLGLQNGVTGTPGSFVNGISLRGALPYENDEARGIRGLKSYIEAELAEADN